MLGDLSTANHMTAEITTFKGLLTNLEVAHRLGGEWLALADDVVYDGIGNVRPRDGYSEWWPAQSQRLYFTEVELDEDALWNGVNASLDATIVKFGSQSRKHLMTAGTPVASSYYIPLLAVDAFLTNTYDATNAQINLWVYVTDPTAIDTTVGLNQFEVTSDVAPGAPPYTDKRTWELGALLAGVAADTWTKLTLSWASGTGAGTLVPAAITAFFIPTSGDAASDVDVYFDDIFVDYTDTTKSYCLGTGELVKTTTQNRYLIAAFGETLYFDTNEDKLPVKMISRRTRNTPTYLSEAENRAIITNGIDANLTFDGSFVRTTGYPVPAAWTFAGAPSFPGGLMPNGVYFYAVSFVYGAEGLLQGESSILEDSTFGVTVVGASSDGKVDLSNIPVGPLGAGVVQRRLYRCFEGAGNLASKFLVGTLADNTTTIFQDTMDDATLALQKLGPIDNGVPSISKYARWYKKGMVYAEKNTLTWSRPGFTLDETPETVPASHKFIFAAGGNVTGMIEFNSVLYIFQEKGLSAARWERDNLAVRPVPRTGANNAQTLGAVDQNAITTVNNQYVLFKDPLGQVFQLFANEEIKQASDPVANILDDVNRQRALGSFLYLNVTTQGQWNALGTLGGNLTATADNCLEYSPSGEVDMSSEGTMQAGSGAIAVSNPINNVNHGNGSTQIYDMRLAASTPGNITKIQMFAKRVVDWTGITLDQRKLKIKLTLYKHAPEKGDKARGEQLASSTLELDLPVINVFVAYTLTFGVVYIPKGESVVFRMEVFGKTTTDVGAPGFIPPNLQMFNLAASTSKNITSATGPTFQTTTTDAVGLNSSIYPMFLQITGQRYDVNILTGSSQQVDLQRWADLSSEIFGSTISLRSGKHIKVFLQTAGRAADVLTATKVLLYEKTLIAEVGTPEPVTNNDSFCYPLRDFISGDTAPSTFDPTIFGPDLRHQHYVITLEIDPNRAFSPKTEAESRISTTYADTFPQVIGADVKIRYAAETNFSVPYAESVYTSDKIFAGALLKFGVFSVEYEINQQRLEFQLRTGVSAGSINAEPWTTVLPNKPISVSLIVSGATVFQYRILFTDDPDKEDLECIPSKVCSVNIGYSLVFADLDPLMPPSLFHFKKSVVGSWASFDSRIHDKTIYLDADGRWATWSPLQHFTCFSLTGTACVAGTSSGGKLVRLFNSDIGDDNPSAEEHSGEIRSHPVTGGTLKMKQFMHLYFNVDYNYHERGYVQAPIARYPTRPGGGVPEYSMRWCVFANYAIPPAGYTDNPPNILGLNAADRFVASQFSHAAIKFFDFRPVVTEIGEEIAAYEKGLQFCIVLKAMKDGNLSGDPPVFATLGGFAFEYFLDSVRGV